MAKSFRELVCWQLAFELKNKVIVLLESGPGSRDFKFRDQLADSARSAPRNIAEDFGRFNPAEIAHYVDFARASLDETENHLRDGVESKFFTPKVGGPLIVLVARCRKALESWHTYLRTVKTNPKYLTRRRHRPTRGRRMANPGREP